MSDPIPSLLPPLPEDLTDEPADLKDIIEDLRAKLDCLTRVLELTWETHRLREHVDEVFRRSDKKGT